MVFDKELNGWYCAITFFSQQCYEAIDVGMAKAPVHIGEFNYQHINILLVIFHLLCVFNVLMHLFTEICLSTMYCNIFTCILFKFDFIVVSFKVNKLCVNVGCHGGRRRMAMLVLLRRRTARRAAAAVATG